MKKVAVQEGLYEIEKALIEKGYEVVSKDASGHVDAIVYESIEDGFRNFNNDMNSESLGAILINSKNKTIDEIVYIIETRRYGRLFT